jgi:peptidyl-prolyl cis-trans isomerase C
MVTLVKDPFVKPKSGCGEGCGCNDQTSKAAEPGYDGYIEPDTKIPPKAKSVLADISVNGVEIPEADVMAEAQQHPAKSPGEALLQAAKALVIRELLLQEAKALDIIAQPQTEPDGAVETENDALIRQLMDREIATPVSDEAVRRRYYDLHKHRFKSETIYEARHILLACRNGRELKANKKLATSLIGELHKRPAGFKQMAKDYSACSSGSEGGNLGQLTAGSTVPEFETVLEKMEAGQIWPEPVESRFGQHIIYLVNKIPGEILPFAYVEGKIGAWLEASSWSKAVSQYIAILAGKTVITGVDLDGATSPLVQ